MAILTRTKVVKNVRFIEETLYEQTPDNNHNIFAVWPPPIPPQNPRFLYCALGTRVAARKEIVDFLSALALDHHVDVQRVHAAIKK